MTTNEYLAKLVDGDPRFGAYEATENQSGDNQFLPIDTFDRTDLSNVKKKDTLPSGFTDPKPNNAISDFLLKIGESFGSQETKREISGIKASRSKRDVDYLTALATDYAMKNPGTSGDPNNIANYLKSVSPDVFNRADKRELYANIISENEPIGELPTEVNRRSQAYRDRIAQEVISKNQISFQDPSSGEIVQVMGKDPQSLVEYMRNKGAIVKYDPFDYSYRIVPSDKMDISMDELEDDVMKQANSGNVYVDPSLMKRMFRFGESVGERNIGAKEKANLIAGEKNKTERDKLDQRKAELEFRRKRDADKRKASNLALGIRLMINGYQGDQNELVKSLDNNIIPDDVKFVSQEDKRNFSYFSNRIKNIEDDIDGLVNKMGGSVDVDIYERMNEGELSKYLGDAYNPILKAKINDRIAAENEINRIMNRPMNYRRGNEGQESPSGKKSYKVIKKFEAGNGKTYSIGSSIKLTDEQAKSLKEFIE